jgi:phenylacetic acid degradation operon negative regulatory protein
MAERLAGLIAGFDAGQTHTTCRLADVAMGRVLAQGTGPGVCHLAAPEGPQRFQEALQGSLREALARLVAGRQRPDWAPLRVSPAAPVAPVEREQAASAAEAPDGAAPEAALAARRQQRSDELVSPQLAGTLAAAAVGASGIEVATAVQRQGLELAAAVLGLPAARLWVGGDERTALRGAFPDGAGIVVISGTGTIAVGRDGKGQEHRCSGWGWMLDGAGSAFDIGRDGLALSLQMADGRVQDGVLRQRLWRALDLDPADPAAPQAIKALVVAPGFMPAGLAALAPVVERLAAAGDEQAAAILERHARALVASVAGVARSLCLGAPPVAVQGGALTHLRTFRQLFEGGLAQRLPQASLVTAAGDAASGALALAQERLPRAATADPDRLPWTGHD